MKQVLNAAKELREAPGSVKELASIMFISMLADRRIVSRIELDSKQKQWLRDEGFQFSFNSRINEWEILIQEKE